MHYRNKRISPLKLKQSKAPCPYHSRVSAINVSNTQNQASIPKQQTKKSKSISSKISQRTKQTNSLHLPKLVTSRYIKTQPLSYQSQQYEATPTKCFDYYEDMRLQNQGWPSNPNYGRVNYARNNDIMIKCSNRVKQIYQDEFYNVRQQLQMINRIKQRFKVLHNIENDKMKLKHLLKQMKSKKIFLQNYNSQSQRE